VAIQFDGAAIGRNEARDHVKYRGLAGAVGAEQTHRLAAADIDADAAHDLARAETLFHAMHSQIAGPRRQPGRCGAIHPGARRPRRLRLRRLHARRRQVVRERRVPGKRCIARNRRRIAHRVCQHVADGIAERGDIGCARARKSGRTAFRGASTEHAE
jgi:hypothetical protein